MGFPLLPLVGALEALKVGKEALETGLELGERTVALLDDLDLKG